MKDRIVADDKVSFALPIPGAKRMFGTVYRVAKSRNVATGGMDVSYGVKGEDGKNRLIPARFVTKEVDSSPIVQRQRDRLTIARDRKRIMDFVNANGGNKIRRQNWMRTTDIKALVRSGQLRTEVVREWDSSTGHQSNMFGGAAVLKRNRMYLHSA